MTPSKSGRDRRVWLFKSSRPLVRKFEQKDTGFLWSAYLNGSFAFPEGLSQEEFLEHVARTFGGFNLLWVIEDDNGNFRSGRGQVAIVGIRTDGWSFQPSAHFFKWATPRNILRSTVSFFQMIRHQRDVGCCLVMAEKKDSPFLLHMKKYGVLFPRGRIPFGSHTGDVFVFSINGKKQ